MTFPSSPDADPDPTTQMAWPNSRRNASGSHSFKSNRPGGGVGSPPPERRPLKLSTVASIKTLVNPTKRRLSTKDLIFLSISMAGAQIAWTVELGYVFFGFGTAPYALWADVSRVTRCLRTRTDMGRRSC